MSFSIVCPACKQEILTASNDDEGESVHLKCSRCCIGFNVLKERTYSLPTHPVERCDPTGVDGGC